MEKRVFAWKNPFRIQALTLLLYMFASYGKYLIEISSIWILLIYLNMLLPKFWSISSIEIIIFIIKFCIFDACIFSMIFTFWNIVNAHNSKMYVKHVWRKKMLDRLVTLITCVWYNTWKKNKTSTLQNWNDGKIQRCLTNR